MAPPKSYAEIVQGARRVYPAPAPALPVLPPSTSSSTVVEVDDAEADAQLRSQPQPAVGPRSTSRSYASAVKGSHSKFLRSLMTSRRHHCLEFFLTDLKPRPAATTTTTTTTKTANAPTAVEITIAITSRDGKPVCACLLARRGRVRAVSCLSHIFTSQIPHPNQFFSLSDPYSRALHPLCLWPWLTVKPQPLGRPRRPRCGRRLRREAVEGPPTCAGRHVGGVDGEVPTTRDRRCEYSNTLMMNTHDLNSKETKG